MFQEANFAMPCTLRWRSSGKWIIYLLGTANILPMRMRSDNFVNSVKTKAMNSHKSALLKNSESRTLFEDPIVKEVRDSRHELSSRLDNDLQ